MRIFSRFLAVALLASVVASPAYAVDFFNSVGDPVVKTDPEPQTGTSDKNVVTGDDIIVTAPRTTTTTSDDVLDLKDYADIPDKVTDPDTGEIIDTSPQPPSTMGSNGAAELNAQQPMAQPSSQQLQSFLTAATSIVASLGSINTREGSDLANTISGLLGSMTSAEAQSAAAEAVNSPNNPANTVAVNALAAMGICDAEEAKKIGAAVGAVRDAGNEKTNTEIKAVASLPPTSTLACDAMAGVNIANAIIDMTGRSGAPTQILSAVMSNTQGFTKNLSVSVDVASTLTNVLNNGWRGAVSSLISSLGGGRINPNAVGCRDSLSKINAAMSCVTRVIGGGSPSSVGNACLNPRTIAAVTGGNLFGVKKADAAGADALSHEASHTAGSPVPTGNGTVGGNTTGSGGSGGSSGGSSGSGSCKSTETITVRSQAEYDKVVLDLLNRDDAQCVKVNVVGFTPKL